MNSFQSYVYLLVNNHQQAINPFILLVEDLLKTQSCHRKLKTRKKGGRNKSHDMSILGIKVSHQVRNLKNTPRNTQRKEEYRLKTMCLVKLSAPEKTWLSDEKGRTQESRRIQVA